MHRHSEDGEEHEHDHEHSRVAQTEFKPMFTLGLPFINPPEIVSSLGITENHLISDPPFLEIFRPPIV